MRAPLDGDRPPLRLAGGVDDAPKGGGAKPRPAEGHFARDEQLADSGLLSTLTLNELRVWFAASTHAKGETGEFSVGVESFAVRLGLVRQHSKVRAAIKGLVAKGLLELVRKGGGAKNPSTYRLLGVPRDHADEPVYRRRRWAKPDDEQGRNPTPFPSNETGSESDSQQGRIRTPNRVEIGPETGSESDPRTIHGTIHGTLQPNRARASAAAEGKGDVGEKAVSPADTGRIDGEIMRGMEARNLTDDPAEFAREWRGEIDELGQTRLLDALAVVRAKIANDEKVRTPDGLIRCIARKGAEPAEVEAAVKRLATRAAEERERKCRGMRPEERARLHAEYATQLAEWRATVPQSCLDAGEELWSRLSEDDLRYYTRQRQSQFNAHDLRRDRDADPNFRSFLCAVGACVEAEKAGATIDSPPSPPHIVSAQPLWSEDE